MLRDRITASLVLPFLAGAVLVTVAPKPAVARPRAKAQPAVPIDRSAADSPAVLAPEQDTIPEVLELPEPEPVEPQPTTKRVVGDDAEYIIDTSTQGTLDKDVEAASKAPPPDPAVLRRKANVFAGIGAPLVTLGASAMVAGAVLGTFEGEADVELEVWAPLMLAGAAVLVIGGPLVARSAVLRREAKEGEAAQKEARLWVPSFSRTRAGSWTAGVVARF